MNIKAPNEYNLNMIKFIMMSVFMLGCLTLAHSAEKQQSLADYKAIYDLKASFINTNDEWSVEAVHLYLETLKELERTFKKAGDFDSTKAVMEERQQFELSKTIPAVSPPAMPSDIVKAQTAYRLAQSKALTARNSSLAKLTRQYLIVLKGYMKSLLEQNKMDEAGVVNEEIKRATALEQELNAVLASKKESKPPVITPVKSVEISPAAVKWTLSGIGEDGRIFTEKGAGAGTLSPTEAYNSKGKSFVHINLNGKSWLACSKGIRQDSWSFWCEGGATLSGEGGDGKRYAATWKKQGTLKPTDRYGSEKRPFSHFSLNGVPWPSEDWGITLDSWSISVENQASPTR